MSLHLIGQRNPQMDMPEKNSKFGGLSPDIIMLTSKESLERCKRLTSAVVGGPRNARTKSSMVGVRD